MSQSLTKLTIIILANGKLTKSFAMTYQIHQSDQAYKTCTVPKNIKVSMITFVFVSFLMHREMRFVYLHSFIINAGYQMPFKLRTFKLGSTYETEEFYIANHSFKLNRK